MGGNRLAERKSVWLGENQCGRGNRFSRAEIIWRGGKSVWLGEIGLAGRKSFGGVGNRCGTGGDPFSGEKSIWRGNPFGRGVGGDAVHRRHHLCLFARVIFNLS